jgi:DNA topoisomerase-2
VEYLEEEDQIVEPKYYLPILPLVLINGSEGIGTGWSTVVLPHRI